MIDPIRRSVTKKYADHSTMDAFSFSFFCDICRKAWRSARYTLNADSFPEPMNQAVHQILWSDQHRAAFERANRDATFEFNQCTVCGRMVCKDCFYVSGTDVSDICKNCLEKGNLKKEMEL